ncbi:MAG TPA: hypothetical protein VGB59_00295 [Allosphingosinicella sp.]|jgi:hypothetical protein
MPLALLLTLQAAAAAPAPPPLANVEFDLARHKPREGECEGGGGEIVVCGRRPGGGGYRYGKWARIFAEGPLVAETSIFGTAKARAYVEGVGLPGGFQSNRVMVGIKVPF